MDTKKMIIADLNLVFGPKEEPMIKRLEDIVLPALHSNLYRSGDINTKYFFWDVKLEEIRADEYVIDGLIIKDTILDIDSRFNQNEGIKKMNLHIPSAPYSAFIIYLKNHKMALVRNGKGSPDIRNFSATIKDVISSYVRKENNRRRENGEVLLPHSVLNVTGIKTEESVRNALRGVKKVKDITMKFFPLNSEWDNESLVGAIDEKWRKVLRSKNANMTFKSPKSIEGVIQIAEELDGYVDVEMNVEYESDSMLGGKNSTRLKNGKLSENTDIDLSNELDQAFYEIDGYCKEKKQMNKMTNNLIVDYQEFLQKRRK